MTDIDKLLQQQTPPPDPERKQQAIAMARQQFEAAGAHTKADNSTQQKNAKKTQGNSSWLRLMGEATHRRVSMFINQHLNQRPLMAGLASASLLAVGLALLLPNELDRTSAPNQAFVKDIPPPEPMRTTPQPIHVERDQSVEAMYAPPAVAMADIALPSTKVEAESRAFSKAAFSQNLASELRNPPTATQGDRFEDTTPSGFTQTRQEPVSTFSIDVDTASYSFVRAQLNQGVLPQQDSVRPEEMINYFTYEYPKPSSTEVPFQATTTLLDSPWAEGKKLIHIGIQGYELPVSARKKSNLVFLLDVSGSMNQPNKLPLVIQSMEMLLTSLQPDDTIAIAVYAGAAGTVLEPTAVREKTKIYKALRSLSAGGSTAGAEGIELAYQLAEDNFDKDAINRVILATDGDFNVGMNSPQQLEQYIKRKRDSGIYLSVLGFGQGNYNDELMQTLSQNGNGIAAYIDTLGEAQKVLVDQAQSALFPIANDVKLQLEFNPEKVAEYRLIGYETRHLNQEDFNNDKIDAGDIGAGHSVTAIYEIVTADSPQKSIDPPRYSGNAATDKTAQQSAGLENEYGFLKIRYKLPGQDSSKLISTAIVDDSQQKIGKAAPAEVSGNGTTDSLWQDIQFSVAVAGFAQLLSGGDYTDNYTFDHVIDLAQNTKGSDPYGYRTEFIQLVRKAKIARDL